MIRRGRTGNVYRAPARNIHGDPVDASGKVIRPKDGLALVGQVKGIVMGGLSASPSLRREESSDTTGQIGIPNANTIKVKFGDRIEIDGVTYKVVSPDRWNYPQSMSGTSPMYAWVNVEATNG